MTKTNKYYRELSEILANYDIASIEANIDYPDANFIARYKDGRIWNIVQKGRITIQKKYCGKDLYIAFPRNEGNPEVWYILPHDTLIEIIEKNMGWLDTKSWIEQGYYNAKSVSKKLKEPLADYIFTPPGLATKEPAASRHGKAEREHAEAAASVVRQGQGELVTEAMPETTLDTRLAGYATAVAREVKREIVEVIIAQLKPLAAKYYQVTGKPFNGTGEIGEQEVARLLDLELAPARTPGYDAIDRDGRKYQIKARSLDAKSRDKNQATGGLIDGDWDAALLVIMDENFDMLEIWETDRATVNKTLDKPSSKGRNERRSMGLSQFKAIGRQRYP